MNLNQPFTKPAWLKKFLHHPTVQIILGKLQRVGLIILRFPPVRFVIWLVRSLFRLLILVPLRTLTRWALRYSLVQKSVAYGKEKLRVPLIANMMTMLVIVCVFFGVIFGIKFATTSFIGFMIRSSGPPVQTVSTTVATLESWQKTFSAVGDLRAIHGADLSSELNGIVKSITYETGQEVKEGEPLITLRAEDDVAKLDSLKATARLAEIVHNRDQKQFLIQGVSQATLDTDAANLANAKALADQQQAIVDKKTIRAPFSGRLGIRNVDVGQYVTAGTSLVTLQDLETIYVDFYLPQQAIASIKTDQTVQLSVDTYPDISFPGKILAVNPTLDLNSRNMQIRASFNNPDRKLLPGMFGHVSVSIGDPTQEVTVPQTALSYNPYGTTAYIVSDAPDTTWFALHIKPLWNKFVSGWDAIFDACVNLVKLQTYAPLNGDVSKASFFDVHFKPLWNQFVAFVHWFRLQPIVPQRIAHQKFVTTGETRGDQVEILKGVAARDCVVIAGQHKLFDGATVMENNDPKYLPSDDAAPQPMEH